MVIRIDIDADQIGLRLASDISLHGDARTWLANLRQALNDGPSSERRSQTSKIISEFKARGYQAMSRQSLEFRGQVSIAGAIARLRTFLPGDTVVIPDAGNHWLEVLALYRPKRAGGLHLNCGLGSMGWAIGAAIGMAFANRQKKTLCITGDGCMLMHGTEISVAAEHGVNLLVLIFNNRSHGRIRLAQLLDFDGDTIGTCIPSIDFAQWMSAMGVVAFKVSTPSTFDETIRKALAIVGTAVVEIDCHPSEVPACLRNWIEEIS